MLPRLAALIALAAPAAAQTYDISHFDQPTATAAGFGRSVDVSGTRAIVGSTGGAWIAERDGSGRWSLVTELVQPDSDPIDQYGYSVALDGDTAVVGAPRDTSSSYQSGSIYVFQRSDGGIWKLDGKLFLPQPVAEVEFGACVDIDGDRIVVGAPSALSLFGPERSGLVHVFDRQPGGWVLDATLGLPGLLNGADFGTDVDVEGDRLVVGAPRDSVVGRAHVFDRDAAGNWQLSATLAPSGGADFDRFGAAVALSADVAAVGAPFHDGFANNGGATWTFARQSGGAWALEQKLGHPGIANSDWAGESLDISGDWLLVGSAGVDVASGFGIGAAQLWKLNGSGAAVWIEQIEPIDPSNSQYSGSAVALDGGWVVLGGPGAGTGGGQLADVLYSYTSSGEVAPDGYGKGTAGCDGLQEVVASLPPLIGTSEFELRTLNAPPEVTGLALVSSVQDGVGSDPLGLGIVLHVDLFMGPPPLLLDAKSDGLGVGVVAIPLPSSPSLVGAELYAQTVWIDPSCAAHPFGLSSSAALAISIAEP